MKKVFTTLFTFASLLSYSATYETLPAQQIDSIISANFANQDFYIIDVRTATEYASGHIANSYNIDYRSSNFSDIIDTLDHNATYVMHCQSGGRSAGAMKVFKEKAFETVFELQGGMNSWTYDKTYASGHQVFRYVDAETAYELSETGTVHFFDYTDRSSFEQFHIPGNTFIDAEHSNDSLLKAAATDSSVLIYSSSDIALDSLFFNLFKEAYSTVYYFDDSQSWISAGYKYNTVAGDQPTSSIIIQRHNIHAYFSGSELKIENTEISDLVQLYDLRGNMIVAGTAEKSICISENIRAVIIKSDKGSILVQR